jgi:hypothetical protein
MAIDVDAIFTAFQANATSLLSQATGDVESAFNALADPSLYAYTPYDYQVPSSPIIGALNFPPPPASPVNPGIPKEPTLIPYGMQVPNPNFGAAPTDKPAVPAITFPTQPGDPPPDFTGNPPAVVTPNFPSSPALIGLPSSALPYPTITVPLAPTITPPVFDGTPPADIANITLDEYLDKLEDSYEKYSNNVSGLVQSNWMSWYTVMLGQNPNIAKLNGIISAYLDTGGAGIPIPIEEAIVTRATDRVSAEARRKRMAVWEDMSKRGLTLPSGALMSGLKESRAEMAEAVSKVALDVATKNLELEHDHMKFMIQFGISLQKHLMDFAGETAKIVVDINGQAIEITKLTLTGMIEINNAAIRIYVAKWEGYKVAAEVFKTRWEGIEAEIRVYEAQIKAELAKTEINKAVVEVLTAVVNANRALVEVYKTQVEAEAAKIEVSRVQIMAFEAIVRAYVAKVEGFRARWDGYKAAVEGQLAIAQVYDAEVKGYVAEVEAYKANVEAYSAQVRGYSAQIESISRQNEAVLKEWSIEVDGLLKAYSENVRAYGINWSAIGEQMRASANVLGIQSEFLSKIYNVSIQVEIERARDHMAQWRSQLEAGVSARRGLVEASGVVASLANSALNGLTAIAGDIATTTVS